MRDIKELIYAAVEENALKFQEIVNAQLQVRAYDAIEALRPEIGASMFGESSHKEMDDEDEDEEMEDEDEDEDEELKGKQHKLDVDGDGKIEGKDLAKLRETQKNIFRNPNVPAKDQLKDPPKQIKVLEGYKITTHQDPLVTAHANGREVSHGNLSTLNNLHGTNVKHTDVHAGDVKTTGKVSMMGSKQPFTYKLSSSHASEVQKGKKGMGEEFVNEVAMPKNQADWQAMINHQIEKTKHPVATDAQFRSNLGKDKSKIASLEPGEDALRYAAAQGGNVKQ